MAYRLIYNPVAGGGKAKTIVESLAPQLASVEHLEVMMTRYRGHARELAAQVAHQPDQVVISVGGDGTHHEIANGLLPAGLATMAVIPAGSGNDFAGGLGIPTDPQAALAVALGTHAVRVDVGQVEQEYFLTVVGAGFDAEVAGLINTRPHGGSGKLVYLQGILQTLFRYRPQVLTVTEGGQATSRPTLLIAVGNTSRYGGGIKICPEADPHDGTLQVVWIDGIPPLAVLPLLAKAYGGHHVKDPVVHTFQSPALVIDGPEALYVHADGELIGHLPVTIKAVPHALTIRVPNRS